MIKLRNIFLVSCLFLLVLGVYLYAQKPVSEQLISQNPEYNALAAKLDFLEDGLQKSNSELSAKLDKVLSYQDKILQELEVVRIRASRSR
jgi:predicted PurR-regulated permease PerM